MSRPETPPRAVMTLAIVTLVHFLLLVAAGTASFRGALWGAHAWSFLPPATLVAVALAASAFGLLVYRAPRFPTRALSFAGLAIALAPLLYLARDRTHLLGDSRLWIDAVGFDRAYHPNEPLAFALFTLGGLDLWHAPVARIAARLELVGVALGTIALALTAALSAEIGRDDRERWAGFGLLAVAGATVFGFGYIEAYPVSWPLVVAFLLGGLRSLAGRNTPVPTSLAAGLAIASHLTGWLLVPAWLVLMTILRPRPRTWLVASAALIGPVVITLLTLPHLMPVGLFGGADAATLGHTLERLTAHLAPGRISAGRWIGQVVNFLMILAPVGGLLAIFSLLPMTSPPRPAAPDVRRFLLAAALVQAAPLLLLDMDSWTERGTAVDWDVYALAAIPWLTLAALAWARITATRGGRIGVAIAISLAMFQTGAFVALNADDAAARQRFRVLLDNPHWPPGPRTLGYEALAIAERDRGHWDAAADLYGEALAVMPGSIRLERIRAGVLSWGGHDAEAAALYLKAARAEPDHPGIWLSAGVELERSGAIDSAVVAYRRAIDQDSTSIDPLNGLARIFLKSPGRREEALQLLRESLRLDPSQPSAPEIRRILAGSGGVDSTGTK